MEFANQLKKYRTEKNLSQEQLAEEIFVTRQTISNWETEKSYPDVHSLMLLSSLFQVSLDQLLKGDIEIMKNEIRKEDIAQFNKYSVAYTILLFVTVVSAIPLFELLKWLGVIIWVLIAAASFAVAFKVEALKKQHHIQTYKEIVAFTEGRTLDEVQTQREIGKAPYQKVLMVIGSGVFAFVLCIIVGIVISFFK